jgi:acetylornithine aminotransferase
MGAANDELLERYQRSVLGVFGLPPLVLDHGDGCWVWDVDGNRYLDLVGGIAVNALGHGHPALVSAVSKQAAEAIHISNLFTSEAQIRLAERLIEVAGAPEGSAVFFANSGAEAVEAAIKLSRRTGRTGIVAAEGAFHGRTTGALALTHKAAYREPFEPLIPAVEVAIEPGPRAGHAGRRRHDPQARGLHPGRRAGGATGTRHRRT